MSTSARSGASIAAAACLATALLSITSLYTAPPCMAQTVQNLTGLPVFPNLTKAAMDRVEKTDVLGHWCRRFAAETPYPLGVVQAWYRRALVNASETDLTNDESYKIYSNLSGIKLALGLNYVTVYRAANNGSTLIELFRCTPAT